MIRAIKGDITKVTGFDAIVNPANNSLLGGGGIDGQIHRAAGPQLKTECRRLNGCETGDSKLTLGYNMHCTYIIHSVGPVWMGGGVGEPDLLKSCYSSAMQIAVDNKIRKIAFSSISTGEYGYPLDQAAKIGVSVINDFVQKYPDAFDDICWVLQDDLGFGIFSEEIRTNAPKKKVSKKSKSAQAEEENADKPETAGEAGGAGGVGGAGAAVDAEGTDSAVKTEAAGEADVADGVGEAGAEGNADAIESAVKTETTGGASGAGVEGNAETIESSVKTETVGEAGGETIDSAGNPETAGKAGVASGVSGAGAEDNVGATDDAGESVSSENDENKANITSDDSVGTESAPKTNSTSTGNSAIPSASRMESITVNVSKHAEAGKSQSEYAAETTGIAGKSQSENAAEPTKAADKSRPDNATEPIQTTVNSTSGNAAESIQTAEKSKPENATDSLRTVAPTGNATTAATPVFNFSTLKPLWDKYDIDWLISEVANNNPHTYTCFWHETEGETNNVLSQWYAGKPIYVNGKNYFTAEQYLMAEKALMFNDFDSYKLIMEEQEPSKCKKLGRNVAGFDEEAWKTAFREIIFHGNLGKALSDEKFAKALIETGDSVLIEASPFDDIYGAGMKESELISADGSLKVPPQEWHSYKSERQSENNLGFVLMAVRDYLKISSADTNVGPDSGFAANR